MRYFAVLALAILFGSMFTPDAHAERAPSRKAKVAGCTTVRGLGRDLYKNSKPHRACSAINCPIDYFEKFPSLLVNTPGTPRIGVAKLIDSNGGALASCGQRACRDCRQGFRYVCGGNTNSIAKTAKARTGKYTAYYKMGSKCVQIPDIGKCVGSVKGLCNRILH